MLKKQYRHERCDQSVPFLECARRNQSNRRQQRCAVSGILVLKQHQTQPSANEPQNDGDPCSIKLSHQDESACDEDQKQRKKQLVTFESASVKNEGLKADASRIPFTRGSGVVDLRELLQGTAGRQIPKSCDDGGDCCGDRRILKAFSRKPCRR